MLNNSLGRMIMFLMWVAHPTILIFMAILVVTVRKIEIDQVGDLLRLILHNDFHSCVSFYLIVVKVNCVLSSILKRN